MLRREVLQCSAGFFFCFTLPWFRHCFIWYRCPNRLWGFLLFKPALKNMSELLHVEHANCRAWDAARDKEREPADEKIIISFQLYVHTVSAATCLVVWKIDPGWHPVPACGWCCWWRVGGWSKNGSLQEWSSSVAPLGMWSTVSQGHAESHPSLIYTRVPHGTP